MAQTVSDLEITGYSAERTRGRVVVTSYRRTERLVRGLKGAAVVWGVTALGAFIPVAHFVIVPVGAFFGFYLFLQRFRAHLVPKDCSGTCPDCGLEQVFDVGAVWCPPARVTCLRCSRSLTLVETR